jgi:hypothetical protein
MADFDAEQRSNLTFDLPYGEAIEIHRQSRADDLCLGPHFDICAVLDESTTTIPAFIELLPENETLLGQTSIATELA